MPTFVLFFSHRLPMILSVFTVFPRIVSTYSFLKVEDVEIFIVGVLLHKLNCCRGNYSREETIRGNTLDKSSQYGFYDPILEAAARRHKVQTSVDHSMGANGNRLSFSASVLFSILEISGESMARPPSFRHP